MKTQTSLGMLLFAYAVKPRSQGLLARGMEIFVLGKTWIHFQGLRGGGGGGEGGGEAI